MKSTAVLWQLVQRHEKPKLSQIAAGFNSSAPFPHLIIDDFFTEEFMARLQREFPAHDDDYIRFCRQDGGEIGTNYANNEIASFPPAYKELDALVASKAFRDYVSAFTGIPDLEYDPDYFGGGIRESVDGFLPPHLDFNYHPRTKSYRDRKSVV